MKNYYGEMKAYFKAKSPDRLPELEKIKGDLPSLIKLYRRISNLYDFKSVLSLADDIEPNDLIKEVKEFKIKSEDKAAFVNRLNKLGIGVDTYKIKDNKLDDYFSVEFIDPQVIDTINQVLKKSPKINQVKENLNPIDSIKMDVPLFIRMLEYAREDAKTDIDLHDVTEKIIGMSKEGRTLTIKDYNNIMSSKIVDNFNPDEYEWEKE
jgi:hypothetical protein